MTATPPPPQMPDQTGESEAPAADITDTQGLEFTPPQGTIEGETEGEALVKWKKSGDKYVLTEFEGKPMEGEAASGPKGMTMADMGNELQTMDKQGT
jgi:hypothetical protein